MWLVSLACLRQKSLDIWCSDVAIPRSKSGGLSGVDLLNCDHSGGSCFWKKKNIYFNMKMLFHHLILIIWAIKIQTKKNISYQPKKQIQTKVNISNYPKTKVENTGD